MKRIAITQRVLVDPRHGERRDCLDQRWAELFSSLDVILVPVSNVVGETGRWAAALAIDGVVLTGGNTLAHLSDGSDEAPERDLTERSLLQWAKDEHRPVFGVCRGMQLINYFLGGQLIRAPGHAGTRHGVTTQQSTKVVVNSYHDWIVPSNGLAPGLLAEAWDDAGNIEAVRHASLPWAGVMWHPERDGLGLGLEVAQTLFDLGARQP